MTIPEFFGNEMTVVLTISLIVLYLDRYSFLSGLVEAVKSMNNLVTHEVIEGPHHFHMANPDSTAQSIEKFINN
jgi:hypothetical protein